MRRACSPSARRRTGPTASAFRPARCGALPARSRSARTESLEIVARRILFRLVAHDKGRLRESEEEGQRQEAESLELDPEVRGLAPPDDLVEDRKRDEKKRPAPGQPAPAFFRHVQRPVEQDFEDGLVEREAREQSRCKKQIKRGRLDLDQRLVVEEEG